MKPKHQPIGIFDSGIGGLTVAHALVKKMPKENIIYFGDTAHLPYGDKSAATIQAYALKIVQTLLAQRCKLILIACHSATAAAGELIQEYVKDQAMVVNVIDPMIDLLKTQYSGKHIGLIGTRQTVDSNIYQKKIAHLDAEINLHAHATSLLAAAIEEFGNHKIIDTLLETYLAHKNLQEIDALVLACTHYPIVKEKISAYYQQKITILDSAEIAAIAVQTALEKADLLNTEGKGEKHFYVSDYTESFANHAKFFFNEKIKLEHYPLSD